MGAENKVIKMNEELSRKQIKRVFEIADDGIQGVVGYFHYVKVCQNNSRKKEIINSLPNSDKTKPAIQITWDWKRYYSPEELYQVMEKIFKFYHVRIAVISLVSIFEGSLTNFIERLDEARKISRPPRDSYKARLEWAFTESKHSKIKSSKDILDICLDVDHTRRVRNLWMHNNGLFNDRYGNDYIDVNGRNPILMEGYKKYMKTKKPTPVILNPDIFTTISLSHITLLHHLHDAIQRKYFGETEGYSYKGEKKRIEWHRVLSLFHHDIYWSGQGD